MNFCVLTGECPNYETFIYEEPDEDTVGPATCIVMRSPADLINTPLKSFVKLKI